MKGLAELLKKHKESELTEEQFEQELNKILPESWIPKATFNELNEKHKALTTQNAEYLKAIDEAKAKNKNADELNAQIEALKTQHKEELDKINAQIALDKKNAYIDGEIAKLKGKNVKAIRALLETDKISVSDSGEYLGLKEQLETAKKDNPFLFEEEDKQKLSLGGGGTDTRGANDPEADEIASAMGL